MPPRRERKRRRFIDLGNETLSVCADGLSKAHSVQNVLRCKSSAAAFLDDVSRRATKRRVSEAFQGLVTVVGSERGGEEAAAAFHADHEARAPWRQRNGAKRSNRHEGREAGT